MQQSPPSGLEQEVLLAVWRLGDEAYGTTVRDELEARTGRELTHGAVYVTLVRLEKKRLVRSRLSDPTPVRGGKAKRFFTITANGIAGLKASRASLDALWEGLPRPANGERL